MVRIEITSDDITYSFTQKDDPFFWDIRVKHDNGTWSEPLTESDGRDVMWQIAALCQPALHANDWANSGGNSE